MNLLLFVTPPCSLSRFQDDAYAFTRSQRPPECPVPRCQAAARDEAAIPSPSTVRVRQSQIPRSRSWRWAASDGLRETPARGTPESDV